MHKEDQQATGGPTSLGVTSEARANPQLSSRANNQEKDEKQSQNDKTGLGMENTVKDKA
ncbi:hypothetical protein Tco_0361796, partial [Tanacetum coccineum]